MRDALFFSNFFIVDDPLSKKNFRGKITDQINNPWLLIRSEIDLDKLTIEHLEGGQEPGSLFWNQVNDPFCIHNDLLDILRKNEISGWSAIPVTIESKNGIKNSSFSALKIHGRANAIDYLESDVVFVQTPRGRSASFKGLYFEPESWDGSDLFMSRSDNYGKSTAFVYASKKLVEIFKKAKVKNIKFTNFNDFEIWCPTITICANESYKSQLENKIREASSNQPFMR